jgi:hypothetical protein
MSGDMMHNKLKSMSLNDIYGSQWEVDESESIHSFVDSPSDWELQFPIIKYSVDQLKSLAVPSGSGNLTVLDAYKNYATNSQKKIVKHYMENDSDRNSMPIVIANKTVLDGNHRLVAAIMKNAPINVIDVYGEEYEGDAVMESLFIEFINQFKTKDNSNLIEAITDGYLVLNESVTRELMYLYQYLKTDDKSDLAFNEPWYLDDFDHGIDDEEFNEYLEEHEYSEAVDWLYNNDKDTFERFVEYVESHNDEGQEGYTKQYFSNNPTIIKNKWLLHFTDNAYDVFKDGFNRGTDDIDKLGLTTYRTSTENGTYGFAYDAANTSSRTYSSSDYHRMFKYGQEAVMFIASGIKVYHYTDEEYQVIFDTRTVRDIVAIEKVSTYMEDDEYDVWGIRNKRGENLFTTKDDSLESFEQAVDWVIANYDNYRKNIDTGKAPSMREPGKNRPQIESIDRISEEPTTLYHATFRKVLPNIKKYGLGSSNAPKNYAWDNDYKYEDHVYLADDIDDAYMYAEASEVDDEIVILAVNSSDLDHSKLGDDPNLDIQCGTYLYKGIIDASDLKLIH